MQYTVLVADDEPGVRALVREMVDVDGTIEVLEASDGQEALLIAREKRPDLVFLDVLMPIMNGYQVCKALKEDRACRSIQVAILTALNQPFDQTKALKDLRADYYLAKPILPNDIAQILGRMKEASHAKGFRAEN